MDGKTMLTQLGQLIQESANSSFLDTKTSYDLLYEAACDSVSTLKLIVMEQDITTVALSSRYNLTPDFLCLHLRDTENRYTIKYYDTANYYWPMFCDEQTIYLSNTTTDQSIPDNFSIVNSQTLPTNITGKTTAVGASANGECTLTDAAATFVGDVNAGDIVHNTTDGSDGIVLVVTDNTHLVTALFNGTADDWSSADDYVIVPQITKQLLIDPPSLTAGHTITVPYISRPTPVYSDYRKYNIPEQYMPAVVKYAAWGYKYRDREPDFGDAWFKYWDMQMRKASAIENRLPSRRKWGVNFSKRSYGNRTMR